MNYMMKHDEMSMKKLETPMKILGTPMKILGTRRQAPLKILETLMKILGTCVARLTLFSIFANNYKKYTQITWNVKKYSGMYNNM